MEITEHYRTSRQNCTNNHGSRGMAALRQAEVNYHMELGQGTVEPMLRRLDDPTCAPALKGEVLEILARESRQLEPIGLRSSMMFGFVYFHNNFCCGLAFSYLLQYESMFHVLVCFDSLRLSKPSHISTLVFFMPLRSPIKDQGVKQMSGSDVKFLQMVETLFCWTLL